MISRRAFLGWLAASIPATALVRRAHAASVDALSTSPRTMRALGEAILPTELGTAGMATHVDRFQRWIAGFRENTELVHGYGTSALERAGPTPATRWARQLETLDASARRRHATSFADLPLEQRRELVRDELTAMKAERIGAIGRAPHVALALLAHFYATPEANDLCYEAKIGKQTCRPLAACSRQPLPLAPRHA